MNDLGQFLFALATLALLSLFDALARRAGQRRRREERTEAGEPRGRPMPTEVWIPDLEDEEAAARTVGGRGAEERAIEERTVEVRTVEAPADEIRDAEPPPLAAAAERLREEGRRDLRARGSAPVPGPSAPVPAAPRPRRTAPAPALARAGGLRAELRRDPAALRRAVLYREVLGPPVALRGPGGWEEPGGGGGAAAR